MSKEHPLFVGTIGHWQHGPENKPDPQTPPVAGTIANSRTQWKVTSVHNDGALERLGKDIYEQSWTFDSYDDVQARLGKLLAKEAVTSVRVATRQVTEWEPVETLTKQWIKTDV